jgi:hypothetical protein
LNACVKYLRRGPDMSHLPHQMDEEAAARS